MINKVSLEKVNKLFKRAKKYFPEMTRFFKNSFIELLILAITCIGVFIAWQSLNIQKASEDRQNFPFFQYHYDNGTFRVNGSPNVSVIKVDWVFPSKAFNSSGKWELRKVGNHPTSLGFHDIRDYLALEVGANTLTPSGKETIECNLYLFSEVGIPALARITYDQNDRQGLISQDFLLITRLDTSIPEAIVQKNGRHIKDSDVRKLFDEYTNWFISALDIIKEVKNSSCGMIMNQPVEGYSR